MRILKKITNGVLLIIIALLHTSLAISPEGGGRQFVNSAKTYFFNISAGRSELPIESGKTDLETLTFFWFFYFGLLLIPLGLLVHQIEKKEGALPYSFTISYLIFVLLGSYMIPNSGMTIIMLPHAIYMLIISHLRIKKRQCQE
jgi:Predicted transcriptional regulator/sugar kinase